ncbi:MAG: DUF1428 domain-containing protein [Alphaproteobacteria bacterium]|nr:DUF1428 domain-containing protein [Alphaproteobacteria bacterium]
MGYIDGVVAAVPTANKDKFLAHARTSAAIFKEFGALTIMENWGDDVPEGKQTDLKRAVQAKPDETVVFSWITWPDKATRDAGWAKMMKDERMAGMEMPFDGKRMIFGGFQTVLET